MLLKDKTALITGSTKGIGSAIAKLFAANGAQLILLARNLDLLQRQKIALQQEFNTQVHIYQTDVSSLEEVKKTFAAITQNKLVIDIVVNNAGIMLDAPLMMLKEDVLHRNIEVNLYGSFHITQAAIKPLIRNKGGSIINLTSIVGKNGSAGQSAYAAAKSGIIGFTTSISKELAPLNIRVNAIAPGYIETELVTSLSEKAKEKTLASIGMKKAGTSEDVAQVALFLASDLSSYVTGQIIGVDGGMII